MYTYIYIYIYIYIYRERENRQKHTESRSTEVVRCGVVMRGGTGQRGALAPPDTAAARGDALSREKTVPRGLLGMHISLSLSILYIYIYICTYT